MKHQGQGLAQRAPGVGATAVLRPGGPSEMVGEGRGERRRALEVRSAGNLDCACAPPQSRSRRGALSKPRAYLSRLPERTRGLPGGANGRKPSYQSKRLTRSGSHRVRGVPKRRTRLKRLGTHITGRWGCFPSGSAVKKSPAVQEPQEMWVQALG